MPPQPGVGKGRPVFRPPIVPAETPRTPTPQVSFADLVRMMAESVADAQRSLDEASAATVKDLAETTVEVVPSVTEKVAADGTITYDHGSPQTVSLLDLGVAPTFYQFSSATVEVSMDLHVVETVHETSEGTVRRYGLFAGTEDVEHDRRFSRDMTATSRLTATMVPVPRPLRVEPTRTTEAG